MKTLIKIMKEIFLERISNIIKKQEITMFDEFKYIVKTTKGNDEFYSIEYTIKTTVDKEFYKSFLLIKNEDRMKLDLILEKIERDYIDKKNIMPKIEKLEIIKDAIIKDISTKSMATNMYFHNDFIISFVEAIDMIKKESYILYDEI